jgi:predicted nucleic acid-binding protein
VAIILDADVIIQSERGTFGLKQWLASQPTEQFQIAAITIAELWHGVERSTDTYRRERETFIRRFLELVRILPYTKVTAIEHARIWAELESSGKMIGYYDIIVAATAVEHGSAVATFNKRRFNQVKGLKVIEPK